jgi:hypothetical protein
VIKLRENKKLSKIARIGSFFIAFISISAFIIVLFAIVAEGIELILVIILVVSAVFSYSFGFIGFKGEVPAFLGWTQ